MSIGPIVISIIAFSVAQTAYSYDLSVGAISGMPKNALETGYSLGFSTNQTWFYVLVPSLFRLTLPAQIAFFIGIVRLTSITSFIGAPDVVFVATSAAAINYRTLEAWLVVGLAYIIIVTPITLLARKVDQSKWVSRRW